MKQEILERQLEFSFMKEMRREHEAEVDRRVNEGLIGTLIGGVLLVGMLYVQTCIPPAHRNVFPINSKTDYKINNYNANK